jgi:hypothetical protein
MVLQRAWSAAVTAIILGTAVFASGSVAAAQQYRPDEFLKLDLSKAVLSPKLLGPSESFTPGPLDVTVGRGNDAPQANAELVVDPKSVPVAAVHPESKSTADVEPKNNIKDDLKSNMADNATAPRLRAGSHATHARAERPAAHKPRTLVALHGRNPAEAQARDTSIQTWPCKSGGICDWKH